MTMRTTIRLLLPAGAMAAACLVIYSIVFWNQPVERAAARLTDAAVALQPATGSASPDVVSSMLADVAARNGYERIWIVDGSGRVEASSRLTEAGTPLEGPWAGLLSGATSSTRFETVEWGGRLMLFSAFRSVETGGWSAILEDGTPVLRRRWAHLGLVALAAFAALALMGIAVQNSVVRKLLRPMSELAEYVKGASTGDSVPSAAIDRLAAREQEPLAQIATALGSLWSERDGFRRDLNERHALYLASTFLTREMIMVAGFDGRIVEANRSFCERLGLDRGGVVGRPLASLEGVLPAKALLELGERSAKERRPFERLLFTFSPPSGTAIDVVAAVQAVPFGREPAFMLVAGERIRSFESVADADGKVEEDSVAERERAGFAPGEEGVKTTPDRLAARRRNSEALDDVSIRPEHPPAADDRGLESRLADPAADDAEIAPKNPAADVEIAPERAAADVEIAPERAAGGAEIAPERAAADVEIAPERATGGAEIAPERATGDAEIAPERAAGGAEIAPERAEDESKKSRRRASESGTDPNDEAATN